jgi:hypothetical protein
LLKHRISPSCEAAFLPPFYDLKKGNFESFLADFALFFPKNAKKPLHFGQKQPIFSGGIANGITLAAPINSAKKHSFIL